MADQRDPTKWLALIVAVVSLGVSVTIACVQFAPRHNFRAYVSKPDFAKDAVVLNLVLVNKGNQVEALIAAFATDSAYSDWAHSAPTVVNPGTAALTQITFPVPPGGFAKAAIESGRVCLSLHFQTIDQRAPGKHVINTSLANAIIVFVDHHGRPIKGPARLTDVTTPSSEDLYQQDSGSEEQSKYCPQ